MPPSSMLSDLASIIRSYLSGHKSRSLKGLSMKTGVAYATLRRIYQQDAQPTMENIVPIIQFICPREEGINFLKTHFPSFGTWLETYFHDDHNFASHELNRLIQDKDNFVILTLAATPSGTTRKAIRNLLGRFGDGKVNSLLENSILEEENGVIRTRQAEFGSIEPDSILAQIKNCAEIFDKKRLGSGTAVVGVQTDGVSEEGLKEIYQILMDAQLKISKIRKEKRGPYTMFTGLILNVIESEVPPV